MIKHADMCCQKSKKTQMIIKWTTLFNIKPYKHTSRYLRGKENRQILTITRPPFPDLSHKKWELSVQFISIFNSIFETKLHQSDWPVSGLHERYNFHDALMPSDYAWIRIVSIHKCWRIYRSPDSPTYVSKEVKLLKNHEVTEILQPCTNSNMSPIFNDPPTHSPSLTIPCGLIKGVSYTAQT